MKIHINISWLHYLMSTIDIYGDFAEEHCLVYANAEVLYRAELHFFIINDNIVIQLIWKFQESNWNPDWFIALMDSFDTNYIFTNNKNLGQYDQNAIPSQIMPCCSYPGNLINLNEIPIELTC